MHFFRTVYFVALENRPTIDVNKQLAFLKASGIDIEEFPSERAINYWHKEKIDIWTSFILL